MELSLFVLGGVVGILIGRVAGRLEMTARRSAGKHAGIIAQALLSGSTAGYTLTPDLPRVADSTRVEF